MVKRETDGNPSLKIKNFLLIEMDKCSRWGAVTSNGMALGAPQTDVNKILLVITGAVGDPRPVAQGYAPVGAYGCPIDE